MIKIKENHYAPWGRVLEIHDGLIQLKVTLDIGPRIIYFALENGPNIMFEDTENKITKDGEFSKKTLRAEIGGL